MALRADLLGNPCGASKQKKKAPEMGASFAASALVAEAYSEM
jgi:hypothetical protein